MEPVDLPKNLTRSEGIAVILRDEILTGRYRAGDRLPSERELSARFAASRGAVREALKKLEQLGVATIQPGGARVALLEDCTLDILGPLLDLDEVPDAKRVDEVLQLLGLMLDSAARDAVAKATDDEIAKARQIVEEMLSRGASAIEQHEAMRRLCLYFVQLADNLVMRLTINGLRMSCLERIYRSGIQPHEASDLRRRFAEDLQQALASRDGEAVGRAMRRMDTAVRERVRDLLAAAKASEGRQRA